MIPEQHRERLGGCHPNLVWRIGAVINELEGKGIKMMVAPDGGLRTLRRQKALYALGRTKPGKIVTNADGVKVKSRHQSGRAADCCFRGPHPYGEEHPWDEYGKTVEKWGLVWGGRWKSPDRPHAELKP